MKIFRYGILALSLFLVVGMYLYTSVLPYRFSEQKPLVMEKFEGVYDRSQISGVFHGKTVSSVAAVNDLPLAVLGLSDANKWIEVDLANQRLYAYENGNKVYDFLISSGKWGRTPTGRFTIWTKLRYTKMEGGNQALGTYYNLPNVPFVMFFANDEIPKWRGFGLHGTYWHENFGTPMSHGCINLKTEDAEKLFYWTHPELGGKTNVSADENNPGTPIIIYGEAPAT